MRALPWILLGLVILWLILRPAKAPDNSRAEATIDSLLKVNLSLRKALNTTESVYQPKIDSLQKASDSLGIQGSVLSDKIDNLLEENSRIRQAYEIAMGSSPIDSICDIAMKRMPIDSATIASYQHNTDHIITTLGGIIAGKDSIILSQHALIMSDSVVIVQQRALNGLQEKQLKTAENKSKITAWLARSLALSTAILAIIVAVK